MDTKKLQELTDIIETRILYAAGQIKIIGMLAPRAATEAADNHLGEAIEALLKLKKELGLHSNLPIEEETSR